MKVRSRCFAPLAWLALIATVVPCRVAAASAIRGRFSTLLAGRNEPRDGDVQRVIPLYELVTLEVAELALPAFQSSRIVAQGWGRLQLGDATRDDHDGDVGLLYIEAARSNLRLRLGRQHLVEGAGRMQMIDGGFVRVDLPYGIGVSAFGGARVHPRLRWSDGGWAAGARLSKHLGLSGEVGLAFKQGRQQAALTRDELALDALYRLGATHWVGFVAANIGEQRISEANLAMRWQAFDGGLLAVRGERTAPDLLLPLDSIFTVFSDVERDAFGARFDWDVTAHELLFASLDAVFVDLDWLGWHGKLGARTYREASHQSVIGMDLERNNNNSNDNNQGYVRGRFLTSLRLHEQLRVGFEAYLHRFDVPINAVRMSILGQVNGVWDITPIARVVLSIAGGSTPYAETQIEGMLRLALGYDLDLTPREAG